MGSGGVENRGLEDLVDSWGSGGRLGCNFQRSLGAKWKKLAASCAQESPRCCQVGQLGDFVASFDTISAQFWKLFRVSFCGWVGIAKSMKTTNSSSLLLRRLGGSAVPTSMKMRSGAVENRGKSWSGGVLWALGGLVDDLVGIFGETWQQDEQNGPS